MLNSSTGDDPYTYIFLMMNVYSYALYWGYGLLLLFLEYFNKPTKFFKYKIQPEKNTLKESHKLIEVNKSMIDIFLPFLIFIFMLQGSHSCDDESANYGDNVMVCIPMGQLISLPNITRTPKFFSSCLRTIRLFRLPRNILLLHSPTLAS